MSGDWTSKDGISNTSDKYLEICKVVENLIRGDAHMLMAGRADATARLIVSNLAHKHGMVIVDNQEETLHAHSNTT